MTKFMASAEFDVVIAGASLHGVTVARILRQVVGPELRIGLIDYSGTLRSVATIQKESPRAFAVAAASKNLLDTLGIWTRVEDDAQPVRRIEITDTPLKSVVRQPLLSYDNLTEAGAPASYIVPDGALRRALFDGFSDACDVQVFSGANLLSCGQDASGTRIEIALDDGSSVTASLLIGADGPRSRVRQLAGVRTLQKDYRQTGLCVRVGFERPHGERAVQHFLPGGPFAILPLSHNRACITWSERRDVADRLLDLPAEEFACELRQRIGSRYGKIEVLSQVASWPLMMHLARHFVGERFALVGDAVRGVHPIAGQGMNLGLRDVAALGDVISDAVSVGGDIGAGEVLSAYERWRRFDSTLSTATFDRLNALFSNDVPLFRAAREIGVRAVDRMPGLKQAFVTEAAGLSGQVPSLMQ
ncbi:MAG: FAD-dependent monooxygenase [Pseudomonadota bacterium]